MLSKKSFICVIRVLFFEWIGDIAMKYRYPGANPFTKDDRGLFFGRDQDSDQMVEIIRLESLVVLYAKSGVGKSSLIQAGIVPRLESDPNCQSFVFRFGANHPDRPKPPPLSALMQAVTPVYPKASYLDKLLPGENTLWHRFKNMEAELPADPRFVLIFDQFEELFTYPETAITDFKRELANLAQSKIPSALREALKDKTRKAALTPEELDRLYHPLTIHIVLSIRGDRLSELNRLKDCFPHILRAIHELRPLAPQQAREAILRPAQSDGAYKSPVFVYDEALIQEILAYLTRNYEQPIATFQLQYICQYVEKRVIAQSITLVKSENLGRNLADMVDDFFNESLKQLEASKQKEQARLVAEKLIHGSIRMTVLEQLLIDECKIEVGLLNRLVDIRLLRSERTSDGKVYYELSHDTLVEPVLKTKAERQRLEELRLIRQQAESERNRRLEQRRITIMMTTLAFLAIGFAAFALIQKGKADQAQTKMETAIFEKAVEQAKRLKFEKLDLSNNSLRHLPEQLTKMQSLKTLCVWQNPDLDLNEIIAKAIKLKNLQTLYLDITSVDSDLTNQFNRLNAIEMFGLNFYNAKNIQQFFSQEIMGSNKIIALDLRECDLSEFPTEIGRFSNSIQELTLSGNKLSELPSEIYRLHGLRTLNLQKNEITVISDEISNLTDLRTLDLSQNQLKHLPTEIGRLTNLTELRIWGNQIETLPKEFERLKKLKKLYLSKSLYEFVRSNLAISDETEIEVIEIMTLGNQQP